MVDQINVGDGATIQVGSDAYPWTVIAVKPGRITLQEDASKALNDVSSTEIQRWAITPNPEGRILEVVKTSTRWKVKGQDRTVHFGSRRRYRDPSF